MNCHVEFKWNSTLNWNVVKKVGGSKDDHMGRCSTLIGSSRVITVQIKVTGY